MSRLALAALALAALSAQARPAGPSAVADPAAYVDTRIGTANGGNTFPGAVLPFGMIAWSPEEIRPDTARGPDAMRAAAAGGYQYDATRIRGFSLTHLSGTGCRGASGDVPFMPIAGAVTTSPSADAKNLTYGADFDHANETATAGYYQVTLASGTNVELTSSSRAGIGRFTYPAGQPATMLIRASDSQVGSSDAHVTIDRAASTVSGSVTSGNFCGYLGTVNRRSYYTLYFVATFDQPFAATGTWQNDVVTPGGTSAAGGTTYGKDGYPAPGVGSGAYVTFAPGAIVHVRVGLSYVSEANAGANLRAEIANVAFDEARRRAHETWNSWLNRIEVTGGTKSQLTIFYTALYHALMHMNLSSDANGEYRGFDDEVHRVAAPQRGQYANFSGWDVYRSQLQIVTLLDPALASDMAQSLLNQATQNHGEWDRWTHLTGATHVMEGDAAAESIPSIVAFGGTGFDMKGAFASLKTAATVPTANDLSRDGCNVACPGQRPSLDKWLSIHYIPTVSNAWGGAGETLEDVSADFALAQMAARLGDTASYAEFMLRSDYWRNVFNPKAEAPPPNVVEAPVLNRAAVQSGVVQRGFIQNRNEDGTWARFDAASSNGFAEGSSAQYTWMIPFNVRGLFDAMGGVATATERLDAFFHNPNGSLAVTRAGALHAEMNNEPSIGTPWLYLFAGHPDRTQDIIRATIEALWKDTPAGIPGNDDLGAMSAWFVWAAMGIHPLAPGRAELVIASPLFPRIVVHRANGKTITIAAPQAADGAYYVERLKVNGQATTKPWLPESFVADGGSMEFALAKSPVPAWGSKPADAPPSFDPYVGVVIKYLDGDTSIANTVRAWSVDDVRRILHSPWAQEWDAPTKRAAALVHSDYAMQLVSEGAERRQESAIVDQLALADEWLALADEGHDAPESFRRRWSVAINRFLLWKRFLGVALVELDAAVRRFKEDAPLLLTSGTAMEAQSHEAVDGAYLVGGIPASAASVQTKLHSDAINSRTSMLSIAQSLFERTLKADPSAVEARLRLARVRIEQGKDDDARRLLDQVRAAQPPAPIAYLAALFDGGICERQKKPAEAAARYREAAAIVPEAQSAQLALASLLNASDAPETRATIERLLTRPVTVERADPWATYRVGLDGDFDARFAALRAELRK